MEIRYQLPVHNLIEEIPVDIVAPVGVVYRTIIVHPGITIDGDAFPTKLAPYYTGLERHSFYKVIQLAHAYTPFIPARENCIVL